MLTFPCLGPLRSAVRAGVDSRVWITRRHAWDANTTSDDLFRICVLCDQLFTHVWTHMYVGNVTTRIRRKHRTSVAFTWCHYQSASEMEVKPRLTCDIMTKLPYWIVAYGTQNSVQLCTLNCHPDSMQLCVTSVIQIVLQVSHDHTAVQVMNAQHGCVVLIYAILPEYMFITKSCRLWHC